MNTRSLRNSAYFLSLAGALSLTSACSGSQEDDVRPRVIAAPRVDTAPNCEKFDYFQFGKEPKIKVAVSVPGDPDAEASRVVLRSITPEHRDFRKQLSLSDGAATYEVPAEITQLSATAYVGSTALRCPGIIDYPNSEIK